MAAKRIKTCATCAPTAPIAEVPFTPFSTLPNEALGHVQSYVTPKEKARIMTVSHQFQFTLQQHERLVLEKLNECGVPTSPEELANGYVDSLIPTLSLRPTTTRFDQEKIKVIYWNSYHIGHQLLAADTLLARTPIFDDEVESKDDQLPAEAPTQTLSVAKSIKLVVTVINRLYLERFDDSYPKLIPETPTSEDEEAKRKAAVVAKKLTDDLNRDLFIVCFHALRFIAGKSEFNDTKQMIKNIFKKTIPERKFINYYFYI